MPRHRIVAGLIATAAAIAAGAAPAHAVEPATVRIDGAGIRPFTAVLLRPAGRGPFAAVVALHGCSGLLDGDGALRRREADWAGRLARAGYVVLLADSFTARGLGQICTVRKRTITPADRARDAAAAAEWLARQPFVDGRRLALIGWSHGAMTVLWTVREDFMRAPLQFKTAIGFYPGCREVAKLPDWRPGVPLTLLLGGADDWTAPGPCRELANRAGFRVVEYPGAYHGFDQPNSRVRLRTGLATVKSGRAHVGTDPAARKAAIEEVMGILAQSLRAP